MLLLSIFLPLLLVPMVWMLREGSKFFALASLGFFAALVCAVVNAFSFQNAYTLQFDWIKITDKLIFPFSLLNDAYTALALIVINFIAGIVCLYSYFYFKHEGNTRRYYMLLSFFGLGMNILVAAGDALTMFVGWELIGICSYFLIGYHYKTEAASKAALKAIWVNRFSDMGYLVALFALYALFSTFNFDAIALQAKNASFLFIRDSNYWLLVLACLGILLAALGKSAQFPLQIWLPDAMQGPTPVSALLHSATMVVSGVFLLIRLQFLILPDFQHLLLYIGLAGGFLAGISALFSNDFKKILAYSTISQLALMFSALGLNQPKLAFFHLCTHAFFKAGLFLCVGYFHQKESENQNAKIGYQLSSYQALSAKYPLVSLYFLIFGLNLCGFPLLAGFASKELIFKAAFAVKFPPAYYYLPIAALLVNSLLTAMYFSRIWINSFGNGFKMADVKVDWFHLLGFVLLIPGFWFCYSLNPFHIEASWFIAFLNGIQLNEITFSYELGLIFLSFAIPASGFVGMKYILSGNLEVNEKLEPKWIEKQYYMESIWRIFTIKPLHLFSQSSAWMDKYLLDKPMHFISNCFIIGNHIIAYLDVVLVDSIFVYFTKSLYFTGKAIGVFYKGGIQRFILVTIAVIAILLLTYFY